MRSLLFKSRRRKAAVLVVVLVLVAAAIATAAWFVQDNGEGKTRAGSLSAITVDPGNTVPTGANQCFPGQPCDAHFQITNPSSNGPLTITAVAPGNGTGTSNNPNCPHTNLQVLSLSGLSVPLPTGTNEIVIPDGFQLSASAPNDCQGAVLTRDVQVTASTL